MFTGLVETLGTVVSIHPDREGGRDLQIACPFAREAVLGESIAISGVCLTVTAIDAEACRFQVGPTTLARTTLGTLQPGDVVNLERSLKLGDRLGGHFVQGHIDAIGTVTELRHEGDWEHVSFRCAADLLPLLVPKGSIAVDGVSLTVADILPDGFRVMLIPHTLSITTLGRKQIGDGVNLETDMIARHLRRLIGPYQ